MSKFYLKTKKERKDIEKRNKKKRKEKQKTKREWEGEWHVRSPHAIYISSYATGCRWTMSWLQHKMKSPSPYPIIRSPTPYDLSSSHNTAGLV